MISIIICSRSSERVESILNNISTTIGVDFEIIFIDNSEHNWSIFQAYNFGVKRSEFEILCFMHDDVVYHNCGWGDAVVNHLRDPMVGMIGVGGPRFLSTIPTIWWAGSHRYLEASSGTICHNSIDTNRTNPKQSAHTLINPEGAARSEVVGLDGLWFCMKKSTFQSVSFDMETYSGFHFYDLDMSMQVRATGLKLYCVFDILLEHISESDVGRAWAKNCVVFYKKWRSSLPVGTVRLPLVQYIRVNFGALRSGYRLFRASGEQISLVRFIIKYCNLQRLVVYFFTARVPTA